MGADTIRQSIMIVNISNQPINQLECSGIILHIFEEKKPPRGAAGIVDWILNGFLSRMLKRKQIRGKKHEVILLPSQGRLFAGKILLFGLGKPKTFKINDLKQTWQNAGKALVNLELYHLAIAVPPHNDKLSYPKGKDLASAMIGGLLEGIKNAGGKSEKFHLILTNFDELRTKDNKNTFRKAVASLPGIQSIGF